VPYRLAVRRPVGTLMLFVGLLIFGLFASARLPLDFLPAISMPTLLMSASYPGASSEEVRQLVTIPLEDAFASLKGVRAIRSVSRRGVATLTLDFQWGSDMTIAGVEAREIIDAAYPLLPQEVERPHVLSVDPNARPVLILGVRSRGLGTARMLADREIKTALQQVEGVGSVTLVGGSEEEVQVQVDQSRLLAAGLTIDDVASFLAGANVDLPSGSFVEGSSEFLVRTRGRVTSPEELADLRIPTRGGGGIRIRDVADVARRPKEQVSLFTANAAEFVGLEVRGRGGESPVRLSQRLRVEIRRLSRAYGNSLDIEIMEDSATTILHSIRGLTTAGCVGGAAAFVVMFLFLRRFRPSVILIASVPCSVLFCLLLLWITGRTINVMSLGGIALSVGMLVDDGVVVLENLQRRIYGPADGRVKEMIVRATSEVAGSILGSTLTTIVVFVPVLFLPGLIGALYADLALAVVFCLLASLIVSVTLIPVLFLITFPRQPEWTGERALRSGPMERGYRRMLAAALRRPRVVAIALLGIALATIPLVPLTRRELVAPFDSGMINVRIVASPSTSLEQLKRIALSASARILSLPNVASVWSRAGGENEDTFYLADPETSRETVTMSVQTRYGRRPDSLPIAAALRDMVTVEGADVSVALPRSSLAQLLGLRGTGLELSCLGATPQEARARAGQIVQELRQADPSAVVHIAEAAPMGELRYTPDRESLSRSGASVAAVARATWEGLEGAMSTRLTSGGRDYDVRILLSQGDRSDRESLAALRVRTPSGGVVETGEIVRIGEGTSPSVLVRENRRDLSLVRIESSAFSPELDSAIARAASIDVIDETRSIFARHSAEIALVLGIALLLLYLLLGAQFESFIQPLIILVAVPLATTGVLGALILTGQSLNLSSGLGVLVLFGIVVKTSIILFANYRRRIDAGAHSSFAVYTGTSERLRPILISTLATIAGLLPIAVNLNGLSTEDGIAIAIIGGLIFSTALTLFVVPLITWRYYRGRYRRRGAHARGSRGDRHRHAGEVAPR
jgi:hydrophobic/amphiphilic exporter-1 (mainly G- bacteria), HAE1 family